LELFYCYACTASWEIPSTIHKHIRENGMIVKVLEEEKFDLQVVNCVCCRSWVHLPMSKHTGEGITGQAQSPGATIPKSLDA
jgi:hypothetical protein